jgi:hypothetical protein
MSDLEQRLSETLAEVAEDAPSAAGLADGARRRHRVRRQRRLAAGGALAALALVAAGVAVAHQGGEDRVAKDPTDGAPGWRTISSGDARAAVPPDWTAHGCSDSATWAPPGVDPCTEGGGVVFVGRDPGFEVLEEGALLEGPRAGQWVGTTGVGDQYLNVTSPSAELTRQILATARLDGQPVVDGAQWVTFRRDGLTYDVPAWWGVGEDGDRSSYSVCLVEPGAPTAEPAPDRFVLTSDLGGTGRVVVTAPTEAVAQLVVATVEVEPGATPGECVPEDFALGLLPPEGGDGPDPVEEQPRAE